MGWQNDRIGLQIERALNDVRITPGCDIEFLVSGGGKISLTGCFVRLNDLDAVLRAIAPIPGVSDLQLDVSVAQPMVGRRRRTRDSPPPRRDGASGTNGFGE
jgi:hypothetical protein